MTPDKHILDHFEAENPELAAQSGIADIWKVTVGNAPAALKIYRNDDPKDEWAGFHLLQSLDGQGAARVLGLYRASALLEWLDGPSLGDLSRAGEDDKATSLLAQTANVIHHGACSVTLPTVAESLSNLAKLRILPDWPIDVQNRMHRAKILLTDLLETTDNQTALHGDLHHDNVKQGARGYVAFDAKGLRGDRCYDMANAFKNPFDAPHIFTPPDRITRLAASFGDLMDLPPKRLLGWAAVHCAAAMIWADTVATDPLQAHLQTLLTALES